jgi:hypothetical protein
VLQARPSISQQDYIIFHVILARENLHPGFIMPQPSSLNWKPIFRAKSSVGTGSFRNFLRFVCGVEDFARVNAHYKRREIHPILDREDCKRACLSCLVRRNSIVLDSEWHALLECPLTKAPRTLFSHAFPMFLAQHDHNDSLSTFVALIILAADNSKLVDEFVRWVGGIRMCRRREFRALSTR